MMNRVWWLWSHTARCYTCRRSRALGSGRSPRSWPWLCVCVFVYVCMYVYEKPALMTLVFNVCMCIYVCMHVCIHHVLLLYMSYEPRTWLGEKPALMTLVFMCVCLYVYMYVCMYTSHVLLVYIHVVWASNLIGGEAPAQDPGCVYLYVCMFICMYVYEKSALIMTLVVIHVHTYNFWRIAFTHRYILTLHAYTHTHT
jgi:hypothetical protein